MALTRGFGRNSAVTPLDARVMDAGRVVSNADGSPRVGLLSTPPAALLAPTASMNVQVRAAVFAASRSTADGVVIFSNDGPVNVPISAAPGSNSRITVIWVKQNDNTQGDADATPVFGTSDGAAAATPTKPSIPTGALELGTIRVYAGTTAANGGSNVTTDTYQTTAMQGGVVQFRTKAELDAWTTPTRGQYASDRSDTSANPFYVWNGTAWRHLSSLLGMASSSTGLQTSSGTAETTIAGVSVAVTLARPSALRLSIQVNTYSSTVVEVVTIRAKDNGTIVADWTRSANSSPTTPGTSNSQTLTVILPTVAAGAHTFTLAFARAVGSGNISVAPSATTPTQLTVEVLD